MDPSETSLCPIKYPERMSGLPKLLALAVPKKGNKDFFYKMCFLHRNGSFWGFSVAHAMSREDGSVGKSAVQRKTLQNMKFISNILIR